MKTPFRELISEWWTLIEEQKPYYIPKAMDLFFAMPFPHQKALLEYIVSEIPNKHWEEMVQDDTQYLDLIRSILLYYSGRPELKQPSQRGFFKLVAGYMKTEAFKDAEANKLSEKAKDFRELLHEV